MEFILGKLEHGTAILVGTCNVSIDSFQKTRPFEDGSLSQPFPLAMKDVCAISLACKQQWREVHSLPICQPTTLLEPSVSKLAQCARTMREIESFMSETGT